MTTNEYTVRAAGGGRSQPYTTSHERAARDAVAVRLRTCDTGDRRRGGRGGSAGRWEELTLGGADRCGWGQATPAPAPRTAARRATSSSRATVNTAPLQSARRRSCVTFQAGRCPRRRRMRPSYTDYSLFTFKVVARIM
ncbi:hypothetical protein EVAR_19723_1 [Eumeta japonica]|uniref:Uncharacterized protein n=1 Tax=Eumeta variegata TaxID=151549 RepID=A0A4C1URT3_EUMVA|nr:hypothetical protein EVAR_19723_1 [Eumeta japonica]